MNLRHQDPQFRGAIGSRDPQRGRGRTGWRSGLLALALPSWWLPPPCSMPACATASCCRNAIPIAPSAPSRRPQELRLEPTRYEPITTLSSSKTEVVCRAVLPLPNGGNVAIDYRFHWQGNQANMSYSIAQMK